LITLEGDGPIVERFYTGTAFVASEDGLLLTNRHVAIPWRDDESAQALIAQGLVPVAQRFVGYLAGIKQSFDVELVVASDEADVAVLRCSGVTGVAKPLTLSETSPQPGDEVIVMGYPTGIRALLARADEDFVNKIMSDGQPDFWHVVRRLSETGRIAPLATRGIVGQVTAAAVVYDAETTSGGSGGPVIGLNGEVVAVNTAILPEFGGSNLGVPVKRARELLAIARKQENAHD
jgi:S1-C subfamily serine protease